MSGTLLPIEPRIASRPEAVKGSRQVGLVRPQPHIEKPLPGIITRAFNYAKAKAIHLINGSPLCTEEQAQRRFAICQQCESFNREAQACAECGCPITLKLVYDSKLRWADSECPHPDGPKWPAEWTPPLTTDRG